MTNKTVEAVKTAILDVLTPPALPECIKPPRWSKSSKPCSQLRTRQMTDTFPDSRGEHDALDKFARLVRGEFNIFAGAQDTCYFIWASSTPPVMRDRIKADPRYLAYCKEQKELEAKGHRILDAEARGMAGSAYFQVSEMNR